MPIDILYILSEPPYPPDNGMRIPAYHSIRLMSQAGYRIGVIFFVDEEESGMKALRHLKTMCADGAVKGIPLPRKSMAEMATVCLLRNRPFFVPRFASMQMAEAISGMASTHLPTAVHFDLIGMTQYASVITKECRLIASINDCHTLALENGLRTQKFRGWQWFYRRFQFWQSKRYETKHYPKFDAVHVMSAVDASYLNKINDKINIEVIPNGVDDSLYDLACAEREYHRLLFIGTLTGANLFYLRGFLESAWSRIIKKYPKAKLDVVGRLTPESDEIVQIANSIGNVNFRGYVEQLTEAYSKYGITIIPLDKNCGIINKMIEAMAAGIAVVAFKSAFAGVSNAIPGIHGIAVESYKEMGEAVCRLLSDERRILELSKRGSDLAEQYYRWETRIPKYAEMYFGDRKQKLFS